MRQSDDCIEIRKEITWLFVALMVVLIFDSTPILGQQQNSTRKIRVKPNAISQRIGSAVNWQPDLGAALAKAKQEGKPVFWYVPTLPNTFMDRKTEIDRYMLSGPFSWPPIVKLLNEHTVPLRAVPTPDQQKPNGLNPYEFVEPGFLILDSNGQRQFALDRLTTIHPKWLLGLLAKQLNVGEADAIYSEPLAEVWQLFADAKYQDVEGRLRDGSWSEKLTAAEQAEAGLLLGMALFRMGKQDVATEVWSKTAQQHAQQPLGWKCAAEAQRIGPFSRGFEVHRSIPKSAFLAGMQSIGSAAPKDCYDQSQMWNRSVDFLLGMQHRDGCFYDSDYDFGGTDSLPNVHVAVTSLAAMALIEAADKVVDQSRRETIVDAIDRALQFVIDDANINKADRDEILWAYAYRLRLATRCLDAKSLKLSVGREKLSETINRCVAALESVQSRRGSWYHEYSNPFVTATALLALAEALEAGGKVDTEVTKSGVAALMNDRFANGAYPYGSSRQANLPAKPGTPQQITASAGRMPICELALLKFDQSDQRALTRAIERSFRSHGILDSARKYDNHTSNLAYGGFFFWYDMRSRSEAILAVKDAETRQKFQAQHLKLILELPELDGCFIDSHELGRVYGTAMALLSLANVNR